MPDEQEFTYYMHDNYSRNERREVIEDQGVVLSEEAWENMGRPFYEIALKCVVAPDGTVTIKEAVTT